MGNGSYQLNSTGHGQIGRHWLAGNFYFPCRRISIFCFSEPLGINIEELHQTFYSNLFWRGVKSITAHPFSLYAYRDAESLQFPKMNTVSTLNNRILGPSGTWTDFEIDRLNTNMHNSNFKRFA